MINITIKHSHLLGLMTETCSPSTLGLRIDLAREQRNIDRISGLIGVPLEKIEHPNQPDLGSRTGQLMFYDPFPIDAWGSNTVLEIKGTNLTLEQANNLGIRGLFMSGHKAVWLMKAFACCGFGQVLFAYVDKDGHIVLFDYPKAIAAAVPGPLDNKYGKSDNGLYIPIEAGRIIC